MCTLEPGCLIYEYDSGENSISNELELTKRQLFFSLLDQDMMHNIMDTCGVKYIQQICFIKNYDTVAAPAKDNDDAKEDDNSNSF